ncbi:MAG: helicase-exonuclease AddAB subunit AddA [Eubacteriaceae bacterium]
MDKTWTPEQLAAIENRSDNLLVSAAAGSGKTALLIERIFRIVIDDHVDVDKLLVLTFTRAAAGEMKNRLNQAFAKALPGAQAQVRSEILRQMNLLANASISTFHVFCLSLLRQYFFKIDLDPAFAIGNETDMAILRKEALDQAFELSYEKAEAGQDPHFLALIDKYSGNRDDQTLKELVEQFYFFLSAQPYQEFWCQEALKNFDIDEKTFFKSHLWGQKTRELVLSKLTVIKNTYLAALKLCEQAEGFEKVADLLSEELGAATRALDCFSQETDNRVWLDTLKSLEFRRFPSSKKMEPEIKNQIKTLRDQAKDDLKGLIAFYDKGFLLAELKDLKPLMARLIDLSFLVKQLYAQKKMDKNALDYNDLEQFALKLLDDEAIAQEVGQRFAYVFIDEYQDTNEMQETILKKIVRPDNYFMVGDVKQSIYRFRLADPSIFMGKYERFGDDDGGKLISLNRNFRSAKTVIAGINEIFSAIMSKSLGEIDYNDQVRLYPGLAQNPLQQNAEIDLIYQPDTADITEELSKTELEARFIAQKINSIIGSPLYRSRQATEKAVEYRDIGVLLRSLAGREEIFMNVFEEFGIPVYFEGGSQYYESLEIRTILNLLNLLDNGHQDIILLSVMTSPMGKFTTDDCAVIRISFPDGFFYEAVDAYMKEVDDPLSARLKSFYQMIEHFRDASKQLPVEDFLWKVYMETGYFGLVGCLPGGQQRQNNLKILLKRAGDYKKSTLRGLYQFVRFIENMKKHSQDISPSRSLSAQENVVRLMTVHKSKGLEFPVVFMAGLNQRFNKQDNYRQILFHKNLGICPTFVDEKSRYKASTIAREVCIDQNLRELLSEEMRILYVGMTRAEEKLHLVAAGKIGDKQAARWKLNPDEQNLTSAAGFIDWIMMAVLKGRQLGQEAISEFENFTIKQIYDLTQLMPVSQAQKAQGQEFKQVNQAVREQIDQLLSFDYTSRLKETLPGKMSVTEIKNLQNSAQKKIDANVVIRKKNALIRQQKPDFLQAQEESPDALERGTALHLFMEVMDLLSFQKIHLQAGQNKAGVREFFLSERDRLIRDKYLEPAQAMSIDLELIQDFFASAIGKRILASPQIKREWPFTLQVEPKSIRPEWENYQQPILVQGIIDCAFMEDDSWVIVDYKTDLFQDASDRLNRIKAYQTQIDFYGQALERLSKNPVGEKIICFIRQRENISLK